MVTDPRFQWHFTDMAKYMGPIFVIHPTIVATIASFSDQYKEDLSHVPLNLHKTTGNK